MSSLKHSLADSTADQKPTKVPRVDDDFSSSVKKKLSVSARTGQACDRCKIRKIRCDARPGGCSPCAQSNAECKTTDRITGRATSRGHVDTLEADNAALRQEIARLRRRLQEQSNFGSAVADNSHRSSSATLVSNSDDPQAGGAESQPRPYDPHSLANILNPAPASPLRVDAVLPLYDPNSVGDNYLGVSSANDWPCPASGSSFSLFGMRLDLRDFVSNEHAEVAKFTTYQSFFTYAFDQPIRERPPIPSYESTRTMLDFWFKLGGSFLPVVHKPHFMNMVERLYKEPKFELSEAEHIQFHCMIAMMQYQLNIRSPQMVTHTWSDHYLWAIGHWKKLLRCSDMPSIQALVMIMCILRNFQRPGAYWIVSAQVLMKLVEAGYHRSVRAWQSDGLTITAHEIEMRKRLFWSVLQCHASLAVRLGRPMLVRLDDFDVELPQLINDNMPEENDLPEHRKCSFLAGVLFFKLLIIQLQIYGQLLCIRPPRLDYESLQTRLVKQMDYWMASLPPHLLGDVDTLPIEDKAFKLYLSFGHQGARLLLHHPAFLRRPNEALMKKDLDVCLDASSKLLGIGKSLKALKVMDSTWHNTTYFFNAIFTSLFAHSYRRDYLTAADMAALKEDMKSWLDVMSGIGIILGSGDRLPTALRHIMSTTIADIGRHVNSRLGIDERPASSSGPRPLGPPDPHAGIPLVGSQQELRASLVHASPQIYQEPSQYATMPFDPATTYQMDMPTTGPYFMPTTYQPSGSAWRAFTDNLGTNQAGFMDGFAQQEDWPKGQEEWNNMPRGVISWPTGQQNSMPPPRGGQGPSGMNGQGMGM